MSYVFGHGGLGDPFGNLTATRIGLWEQTAVGARVPGVRWWDPDSGTDRDRREALLAHATAIATSSEHRRRCSAWDDMASFYSGHYDPSAGTGNVGSMTPGGRIGKGTLKFNLVQQLVDTVVSLASRQRAGARFLPDGGDFEEQLMAQDMQRLVDALVENMGLEATYHDAFRDACIYGTGILLVDHGAGCDQDSLPDNPLSVVRIQPHHLLLDPIHTATPTTPGGPGVMGPIVMVRRVQATPMGPRVRLDAWCMPPVSGKKGRYLALFIDDAAQDPMSDDPTPVDDGASFLVDEEYDDPVAPLALFTYDPDPVRGASPAVDGRGIGAIVGPIQESVEELWWDADQMVRDMATIVLFKSKGIDLTQMTLDDDHALAGIGRSAGRGGGITVVDVPPNMQQPELKPLGDFRQADWLLKTIERRIEHAHNLVGVARMTSTTEREPGVYAAEAYRELGAVQTERFATIQRRYERSVVDVCIQLIRSGRRAERAGIPVIARVEGGFADVVERLRLKDLDIDEDRYTVRPYSASTTRQRPEGRQELVKLALETGSIQPAEALKLIDNPDPRAVIMRINSRATRIEQIVGKLLRGTWVEPKVEHDLPLGVQRCLEAFNAHEDSAPEEVLDFLIDWVRIAQELMKAQPPPGAVPPQATPGSAIEAPGAPPAFDPATGGPGGPIDLPVGPPANGAAMGGMPVG